MHCPNCSTPMTVLSVALAGRPGEYTARLLCQPCLGEEVTAIDVTTGYALTLARKSEPFTIAKEGAAYD